MKTYVADSFALIELRKQNARYKPYKTAHLIITENALLEFSYYLLREKKDAKQTIKQFWQYTRHITQTVAYASIKMKFALRKKKLSYTDCLGYCLARELKVPFLTGDKQFKDLPNVEWCDSSSQALKTFIH